MKKIMLGVVSLLMAITLIMPNWFGAGIESHIEQFIAAQQADGLEVVSYDYQRHWFSSDVTLTFNLPSLLDSPDVNQLNLHIGHGPIYHVGSGKLSGWHIGQGGALLNAVGDIEGSAQIASGFAGASYFSGVLDVNEVTRQLKLLQSLLPFSKSVRFEGQQKAEQIKIAYEPEVDSRYAKEATAAGDLTIQLPKDCQGDCIERAQVTHKIDYRIKQLVPTTNADDIEIKHANLIASYSGKMSLLLAMWHPDNWPYIQQAFSRNAFKFDLKLTANEFQMGAVGHQLSEPVNVPNIELKMNISKPAIDTLSYDVSYQQGEVRTKDFLISPLNFRCALNNLKPDFALIQKVSSGNASPEQLIKHLPFERWLTTFQSGEIRVGKQDAPIIRVNKSGVDIDVSRDQTLDKFKLLLDDLNINFEQNPERIWQLDNLHVDFKLLLDLASLASHKTMMPGAHTISSTLRSGYQLVHIEDKRKHRAFRIHSDQMKSNWAISMSKEKGDDIEQDMRLPKLEIEFSDLDDHTHVVLSDLALNINNRRQPEQMLGIGTSMLSLLDFGITSDEKDNLFRLKDLNLTSKTFLDEKKAYDSKASIGADLIEVANRQFGPLSAELHVNDITDDIAREFFTYYDKFLELVDEQNNIQNETEQLNQIAAGSQEFSLGLAKVFASLNTGVDFTMNSPDGYYDVQGNLTGEVPAKSLDIMDLLTLYRGQIIAQAPKSVVNSALTTSMGENSIARLSAMNLLQSQEANYYTWRLEFTAQGIMLNRKPIFQLLGAFAP